LDGVLLIDPEYLKDRKVLQVTDVVLYSHDTYSKSVGRHSSCNFSQDDDFVFEDFARLRLKGMKDEEDDHFC
ncbi:Arrestin red cell isoform 2, partial [Anabarilius grahami]